MTTKRNKGFGSLDLVLPVAPHYRSDPQVLKDVETMRTNATSRWAKDDHSQTPSDHHKAANHASKIAALARPKVELLRANSPTLKRLIAVRIKLEKYANSIAHTLSVSRQSVRSARETPYPAVYDKMPTTISNAVHLTSNVPSGSVPIGGSSHGKSTQIPTDQNNQPLDKITYEKTWSKNGNLKQKCSLEIWLPKPGLDDDDDDDFDDQNKNNNINENMNQMTVSTVNGIEKKFQSMPLIKSRRSSIVKITATSTVTNLETKSVDEISSKKSESIVVPRVYHYGDYIMDLPEERPRSSKSVTTVKSDGTGSIRSFRRQQTRPQTGRHSTSTNQSEEVLRFVTIEAPVATKDLCINTKTINANREIKSARKYSNPAMINELMHRYSLLKKNHQELTLAKLQLEKHTNNSKTNKDRSPRPPPVPDSTIIISSDHPTVSVKKLSIDSSPSRTLVDQNNTNSKLLDRRATPRKFIHSDNYPQLRIFSLANQQQHRQTSAAYLPTVTDKKPDETYRTLQRSKTVDVVLDIPAQVKRTTRIPIQYDNLSSNTTQRSTNNVIEENKSNGSKRNFLNHRFDQSKQKNDNGSLVGRSGQFYYPSTTSRVLVNMNHNSTDLNYA